MNASQYILEEITDSIRKGSSQELEKFAKRYPKDRELARIRENYLLEKNMEKTMDKLENLMSDRKITHSGGTQLNLADRREMISRKLKRDD